MVDCKEPTYRSAKFKGVEFHCESTGDEFGRRGHLYEYPLSEDVGFKDLGRKARRFKVEGYLIGTDQIEKTKKMADAAESKEPGTLIHPMYGNQTVSCVTLTVTADYKKDKKRTKLVFEFIEANPSKAPFQVGIGSLSKLFDQGSEAVNASIESGEKSWTPTDGAGDAAAKTSGDLAKQVSPAKDEQSFDTISKLQRAGPRDRGGFESNPGPDRPGGIAALLTAAEATTPEVIFGSFAAVAGPINEGTATIRRIHVDALVRLRAFNHDLVTSQLNPSAAIEALIVTARLCLVRDYALVVAATVYQTVHAALEDLDFVIACYDDEERAATTLCDDRLVAAIRAARAGAVLTILNRNIRLPGIVRMNVGGVWPSLVVAQKKYFDGKRYDQVEAYNPSMPPFFIGREITTPAY